MGNRTRVRLKVLALLPICILGALADDQDRSLKISSSGHGPETRIVSNATELGRALQDHMITNIIVRGRVHLKNENWVAGGTASILRGRHVVLQSEHVAPASAVLDFGLLTDAIHVGPDAHLEFQRLHVPNSGNRKLKHPTQRTRLHVAGAFALWPSVTLAKGSQMSMHDCVFYYWSDEQWDSCDKFREAATPILNPKGVPGLLDWRASGTQVSIKGRQQIQSRLVDIFTKANVGTVTMTRTNHTLVCVPAIFTEQEGSPLMIGALSIAFSLLAAAGIAWYIGMLDFNFSREPRRTKSGGSSSDTDPGSNSKAVKPSTLGSLAELLRQRERATIGGLELGELLGRGSFGRVYKGRWCGGLVAVKIVAHNCALASLAEVLRESALSTSIQHPNVVTTFKVRTVRSKDGVYTNPVSTWLHGTDNDLDSIAGTHQELLQKALSQANTSVTTLADKRLNSLLGTPRAKDSPQRALKQSSSVPPGLPATGEHEGLSGPPKSLDNRGGSFNEPDAFRNLLARLKASQSMHMASDAAEKSSSAPEMKARYTGEGLRPVLSVDSAKPLYEEEAGSEISWGPDDSQPLTMQHKANCNQWPPYQHSIMADGSKGEEPDEEPQPLTKAIKGGALESSSLERSSSLEASLVALRPPPSLFRAIDGDARESRSSSSTVSLASMPRANNAFSQITSTDESRHGAVLKPQEDKRIGGKGTAMSYSPGAEEQHNGELKKARQHGIELLETWLILEYCDCGSLEDSVLEGKYKNDLKCGLLCLMDIAAGMEHLHSMGVLHGDLKGANVLMKSAMASTYDPRGYVCKLADFGLSRVMEHNCTHVSTATFGTAAYMPAELLLEGKMTKSADVYGFSMLAWELFTGEQLFKGLRQSQVICKVMTGWRPVVPENLPQDCADLLTRCWAADATKRPSFGEVLQEMKDLVRELPSRAAVTDAEFQTDENPSGS